MSLKMCAHVDHSRIHSLSTPPLPPPLSRASNMFLLLVPDLVGLDGGNTDLDQQVLELVQSDDSVSVRVMLREHRLHGIVIHDFMERRVVRVQGPRDVLSHSLAQVARQPVTDDIDKFLCGKPARSRQIAGSLPVAEGVVKSLPQRLRVLPDPRCHVVFIVTVTVAVGPSPLLCEVSGMVKSPHERLGHTQRVEARFLAL
mmetsp:Transcript_108215/g.263010  ORF Transcript_108215/g.263010 Transcript_108215/m.263010 type:complete len:200 (-) Transcript_108215:329-928(-)